MDRFSIPKFRDYERPNPGILGLENNVINVIITREMHAFSRNETMQNKQY